MGLSSKVLKVAYNNAGLFARNMVRIFSSMCRELFSYHFPSTFRELFGTPGGRGGSFRAERSGGFYKSGIVLASNGFYLGSIGGGKVIGASYARCSN
jgi:hypothetical protein